MEPLLKRKTSCHPFVNITPTDTNSPPMVKWEGSEATPCKKTGEIPRMLT